MSSKHIDDYALIGDCETAALVARDGAIDWLCWPRFDSDSLFAALLGTAEHGRWRLGPANGTEAARRHYRGDSLILETHFAEGGSEAVLTDFMPPRGKRSDVVRLVHGVRGRMKFAMQLSLRFGYGRERPWISRVGPKDLSAIAGSHRVVLRTPAATRVEDFDIVAEFEVAAGETVPFTLSYAPSFEAVPGPIDAHEGLNASESFWKEWSARNSLLGQDPASQLREPVMRSLITLKALTHAPTGGIVAAPTTSLPEELGGERNWDYRFCWIRDATITLLALLDAGYLDEAAAWRDWLLRAVAGDPEQIQIMYGIGGERRLHETVLDWLPGYEGARPVRIGNAAHHQLQLDVFGELMDALHQGREGGLRENDAAWSLQLALCRHLEKIWHNPDEGLWEVRSGPQQFTHSKVMAWVAFDRSIKTMERYGVKGPLAHWRALRQKIHDEVCARGFNKERGAFVQVFDTDVLDASLLLLPTLGFIKADDARFEGTVAAIERELMTDGLVRRYDPRRTDDGLNGQEGMFLACSFWLADAYAMLGRMDDAQRLFGRLLELRNDVGLLAEEYDTRQGRQLGNFPQAYSHVALINTAKRLGRASPSQERAPATT